MSQENSSGVSQISIAISSIRETTKWLVTAFSAIGVLLIAGSQLSGIGKINSRSLLIIAISGGLFGLFGVGLAIWSALSVLTPVHTTPNIISKCKKFKNVRKFINNNRELLQGEAKNVCILTDKYITTVNDHHRLWEESQKDPSKEALVKEIENRRDSLDATMHQIIDIASYEYIRRNFISARRFIFLGGIIAAIGIGVFAWASNRPASQSIKLPITTKIVLKDEGRKFLQKELGENCVASDSLELGVIAIDKKDTTWEVITFPQGNCDKTFRFIVTEDIGIVVPKDYVPQPPIPTSTVK